MLAYKKPKPPVYAMLVAAFVVISLAAILNAVWRFDNPSRAERLHMKAVHKEIRSHLKYDPEFLDERFIGNYKLDPAIRDLVPDAIAMGELRAFNGYGAASRHSWFSKTNDSGEFESLRVGGLEIYRDGVCVLEGEI